jgi:hypothetical protein
MEALYRKFTSPCNRAFGTQLLDQTEIHSTKPYHKIQQHFYGTAFSGERIDITLFKLVTENE